MKGRASFPGEVSQKINLQTSSRLRAFLTTAVAYSVYLFLNFFVCFLAIPKLLLIICVFGEPG
jgi:hypothetical protein